MFRDRISENIAFLKQELIASKHFLEKDIVSIMLDGSLIRGDFLDFSSDIDITITLADETCAEDSKKLVCGLISKQQDKLPKRKYPSKPLIYDLQWQNMNLVKETGQRKIEEWSNKNIPSGYPKLWLYSFDLVKFHEVIFGLDVTDFYTKIHPVEFVPLRLKRIYDSALACKGEKTDYETATGAVTQIKNAWESIRCLCILNDNMTINKNDVYEFASKYFIKDELRVISELKSYYMENDGSKLFSGDFRKRLSDFTLKIIKRSGATGN